MNQSTKDFIRANASGDVRQLALQAGRYPDVDMPTALDQIAGRQTARRKLPLWAEIDDIIYPPHISMEQCSSEFTARYKADVAKRIVNKSAHKFVDMTGGFGVDFSFMARSFDEALYVERQQHLCKAAEHNFSLLGLSQTNVVCGDGVDFLHGLDYASLIFLDPARRDANGGKTVAISDCTPDVLALKDELLSKADAVMLKLSPMLDWHKAVYELGNVTELHIVSSGNECKELLFVMTSDACEELTIYCVNDDSVLMYRSADDNDGANISSGVSAGMYLYEPNASVMKAGCFRLVCKRYGVEAVGRNSHLFVSPAEIADFPGRRFLIDAVTTMNKKEQRRTLSAINNANIAVRNFPMSVVELRKRLKLGDGGDTYIFATTVGEREHLLFVCHKA